MEVLVSLLVVATILLFVGMFVFLFNYSFYASYCKRNADKWNYGTFQDFQRELVARDWTLRDWEKLGEKHFVFNADNSSLTDTHIRFGQHGMVLGCIDYVRYMLFLRHLGKLKNNRDEALWRK